MKLFALVSTLALAGFAEAQTCDFPLCPAGQSFSPGGVDKDGPFGVCTTCDWAGFCAHELDHCPAGSTLNDKLCTWNICGGASCGGELPVCEASQTFTGTGTDAMGPFATCQDPNGPGGTKAFQVKRCATGWTLQPSGMCRKACLPDLIIKYAYLRSLSNSVISSVPAGKGYFICADVVNIGGSTASSSILGGGGLGVPVAPTVLVPSLAPSASAERCLYYANAPSPGTWHVGLTANSTHGVAESSFLNNDYLVTVVTTP